MPIHGIKLSQYDNYDSNLNNQNSSSSFFPSLQAKPRIPTIQPFCCIHYLKTFSVTKQTAKALNHPLTPKEIQINYKKLI